MNFRGKSESPTRVHNTSTSSSSSAHYRSYVQGTPRPLSERERLIYSAKLCEQAEDYRRMLDNMFRALGIPPEGPPVRKDSPCTTGDGVTDEERSLLGVALKNALAGPRHAWRKCLELEASQRAQGFAENANACQLYRESTIGTEVGRHCDQGLQLIRFQLMPIATDAFQRVFYLKTLGDLFRYRAEVASGQQNIDHQNAQALTTYEQAMTTAKANLHPCNGMRLATALNMAVFHHEVRKSTQDAVTLAREAFEEAVTHNDGLDALDEPSHSRGGKSPVLILQLIRDNVSIWTSEAAGQGQGSAVGSMRTMGKGGKDRSGKRVGR